MADIDNKDINPNEYNDYDKNINSLDSSAIIEDKVFSGVVEAISPKIIANSNKAVLDAFIDVLTKESPISVNILDVFSKNKNIESIDEVQNQFAKMYLNNFWYVWNKAKNDYKLKNRLSNLLSSYQDLNNGTNGNQLDILDPNLKFFDDEDSLYTVERYILGKEFKEKKGTATAIEYAYKVGWLAGVEGPLRSSYEFNLTQETCIGLTEGFTICCNVFVSSSSNCSSGTIPNPPQVGDTWSTTDQVTGECEYWEQTSGGAILISKGFSKRINEFRISETVDTSTPCVPFTYKVEGSMLPELFENFVIPLAHPVGFSYLYDKLLRISFRDYFNVEYIYRADKVSVFSLCPDCDCSEPKEDIYWRPGYTDINGNYFPPGGLAGSELRNIEKGEQFSGEYQGYKFEKYTFENGNFLITYILSGPAGEIDRVVRYYDMNFIKSNNIVKNGKFNTSIDWYIEKNPDNENFWYINTGAEEDSYSFYNNSGAIGLNSENRMTQEIVMTAGETYLIEIGVSQFTNLDGVDVNNPLFMQLGSWPIYGETPTDNPGDINYPTYPILGYDDFKFTLDQNIDYSLEYIAKGGEKIEFYVDDLSLDMKFKIDNIGIFNYEPTKEYTNCSHSVIQIFNPKPPIPLFSTTDNIHYGMYYTDIDRMQELYYDHNDGLDPIIGTPTSDDPSTIENESGNIIINEYHYGQAEYITTGVSYIVDINKFTTVDYSVKSTGIGSDGVLNTRYESLFPRTNIDLNDEDFTDTLNWKILLVDIDLGTEVESITNEGSFIIGVSEGSFDNDCPNIDPGENCVQGYIIPWGDPSTVYMFDNLSIDRDIDEVYTNAFDVPNFKDPSKWRPTNIDWTIEEPDPLNVSVNYAQCSFDENNTRTQNTILSRKFDTLPTNDDLTYMQTEFSVTFEREEDEDDGNGTVSFYLSNSDEYNYDINNISFSKNIILKTTVIVSDNTGNISTKRYQSLQNQGIIDLAQEDFNDITKWKEVIVNKVIKYHQSRIQPWMGILEASDTINISASIYFEGVINSIDARWMTTPVIP